MSVSNGRITAPVSIQDVKTVLGMSSNDVGTLCKSGKINKWSKYKPVSYPALFPSGEAQWRGDAASTLWGMQVDILDDAPIWNGGKDVYEESSFPHYNYVYDKPVGGAIAPYRLQDFNGYNHNATELYIQEIQKGTVDEIYVHNTTTETEKFYFFVYSGGTGGIKFSDIADVVSGSSVYGLRLVLSIYKKDTDTLIGEYFNDGIKLYKGYGSTLPVIDNSYDTEGYKKVSITFKKSEFWGNDKSNIDIYLSLQTIREQDSYPNGMQYVADKIIALPYTDNRYYKTSFKFLSSNRYIVPMKLHDGATADGKRNWVSIGTPIRLYDTGGTPDIMFTVGMTGIESLIFQNGVCFLRTKYHRSKDGQLIIASGTLTSESGSNVPSSVEVPKGSGSVDVYFHFGNMFQESHVNGYYPAGTYICNLYLVKIENGTETETEVGRVAINTK